MKKHAIFLARWVAGFLCLVTPLVADAQQLSDSLYRVSYERCVEIEHQMEGLEVELNRVRSEYRTNAERREALTPVILELESRLMALQGEISTLRRGMRCYEETESLVRLEAQMNQEPSTVVVSPKKEYATAPRKRNLIDNACFAMELPAADYAHLQAAQRGERQAAMLVEYFAENYARLISMQECYLITTEQREADSLYEGMSALLVENRELEDSLDHLWTDIFDQKSYLYSFLLEKTDKEALLEQHVETLSIASAEADSESGRYASDALAAYFIEKRALVECEQRLASEFDLRLANDSLAGEMEYLQSVDYRLPRVELVKRYLLDYEPVNFSAKSRYTANNVPTCKVYEHGTIYRIRLGSYKYRQQVSIFRNVEPLYLLQEGGRFIYYTGGFATKSEARLACELLRNKGFRQPIIVRWVDGVKEDVSEDEPELHYRVEISGVSTLSEAVRSVVRSQAAGKELAKVGATFVVGPFDDESVAEQLASAIRLADGAVQVAVTKLEP